MYLYRLLSSLAESCHMHYFDKLHRKYNKLNGVGSGEVAASHPQKLFLKIFFPKIATAPLASTLLSPAEYHISAEATASVEVLRAIIILCQWSQHDKLLVP